MFPQEETIPLRVKVILMGKDSRQFEIDSSKLPTLEALQTQIHSRLAVSLKRIRVFNSEGVQYEEQDLKYLKAGQVLYVSGGEEFDPLACLNEYEIINKIGQGGFGQVYKARHKQTGEYVAIKLISAKSASSHHLVGVLFKEVQILKRLSHPSIIDIKKCFTLKDMRVVIIMEFMEGGQLGVYLNSRQHSEDEIRVIFTQILKAIAYCHQENLIHKDLKPQNILLARPADLHSLKVADFGIAGIMADTNQVHFGTLRYMPPQILCKKQQSNQASVDIWALGCILFHMALKRHPFPQKSTKQLILAIIEGKFQISLQEKKLISQELLHLIKSILIVDHKLRFKISDILCHPWVQNQKFPQEEPQVPLTEQSKDRSLSNFPKLRTRKLHERLSIPRLQRKKLEERPGVNNSKRTVYRPFK